MKKETTTEKDVYSATLLITEKKLNPQEVTALLGVEPNEFWREGERKFPDSASAYQAGGWKCFLPATHKHLKLDEQIGWWCETLKDKASVMQTLEENGYRLEMNCFATNAFQIPPEIMERLSKLRLILTVYIY